MTTALRDLVDEGRLTSSQVHALEAGGLRTLEDVAALTPERRRTIPNVGHGTLETLDGLIAERLPVAGGDDPKG
jgi:hypothetical protein